MSLKFKDFFELMTVEYSSTPDDVNEGNGEDYFVWKTNSGHD